MTNAPEQPKEIWAAPMQIDTDTLRKALEAAVKPLVWAGDPDDFPTKPEFRRWIANPASGAVYSANSLGWWIGMGHVNRANSLEAAKAAAQADYKARSLSAIDLDALAKALGAAVKPLIDAGNELAGCLEQEGYSDVVTAWDNAVSAIGLDALAAKLGGGA